MTKYKTEKRNAEVGERILITEDGFSLGYYKNGDVFTVSSTANKGVTGEDDCFILHREYEVIVGEHTPAPNLDEMDYDELVALVEDAMKALRTRSYKLGYDQGRFDAEIEAPKSDQQKRDEIVEKAREDVEHLVRRYFTARTEFIVNTDKRTVVALRKSYGFDRVLYKGIAKCAPNDCFNAHIGKAIAVRRALGLEVPAEYLNVPQPTEVRAGDVVRGRTAYSMQTYEDAVRKIAGGKYEYASGGYDYVDKVNLVVIDDSRTEVNG
ncbi:MULTISPECIES: hypothetical protein [unclassified Bacillus (in: firmicutes)]|uniref:hypothetical protein n=1 Tax=unclassified Bacillus (in: firmicutes) TaxID=185979 RepID=UPI00163C1424|nr:MULTISPECIES: hypothetical protein [unclassified Bacillus (in: firmicutes)]QNH48695.1 hypothetical protein H7F25_04270 [Bacillus sp. PAMC28571]QNK42990.1 hypothetical protein H7F24_10835 [Bacillus sp. PAMC22265]